MALDSAGKTRPSAVYSSGSDAELMIIKAAHRSRFTVIPMTGNIREELVRVTAGEDTRHTAVPRTQQA
jgi:hypothetical protein